MTAIKPELITIIEGPTPDFHPTPHRWLQSIHEGPDDRAIALCQLRTNNGNDIITRCEDAWHEGRPVKLDYPDEMRMRQQADVVAMRLESLEEGPMLSLWVSLDFDLEYDEGEFDDEDFDEEDFDDEFDDEDDGLNYF
ncbi:MAG: hypothetical protein KA362_03490 [Chloroflexi bacterium]|jgi:hypothetical protein|nr:hypothetical protein [Chloroflexota bacterium]MBK6708971.1 hypothetical protein [Chloroflexota bacterium]MBK7175864.1 hypothetical protein [Chloroflexota bacterium]MBK7914751.1 hypothetical protein [Chloroflexota bacterium]MBK8934419.1 hypothetical protein [Chloroflexota bacterium]